MGYPPVDYNQDDLMAWLPIDHYIDAQAVIGLTGVDWEAETYDLGHGASLARVYAHVMAHFVMAFSPPASPGMHHPAPWVAVPQGQAFDISAELIVHDSSSSPLPSLPRYVAWWITALLRLRSAAKLRAVAISNSHFEKESAQARGFGARVLEVDRYQLELDPDASSSMSISDLEWVRDNWLPAYQLLEGSPEFVILISSLDQAAYNANPNLALLLLWTALEALYLPARSGELRYRISLLIATHLEPPGPLRQSRQKNVAKLYDERSAAAHGKRPPSSEALTQTYRLAREVVTRIVEDRHAPTWVELEERMLSGI